MNLVVFSHKPCWRSEFSPSGFASDGGFPFQMKALSELFDSTTLALPCLAKQDSHGESVLVGQNLSVLPLSSLSGQGLARKLLFPFWLVRNLASVANSLCKADAVHAAIPGDVGTIGLIGALLLRKPLFLRHCGNWINQRTAAEKMWRWLMEWSAGGRNVMFATGGEATPPSRRNASVQWIFATTLSEADLVACATCRPSSRELSGKLITVGRQEHGKGTDLVIRALPILQQQFPNVGLEVVGDGSELDRLRDLADSLELRNRVTFHGKVSQSRVMELLRGAELFCFPSASEGFPKAVLEALACGLPVVANPVSVLPRLLHEGAGLLLTEQTPEAMAAAITRILVDREDYSAFSSRALNVVRSYSLQAWRTQIGEALQRAWNRPLCNRPVFEKHLRATGEACSIPIRG